MVYSDEQKTKKINDCIITDNSSNFRSIMKLPKLPLTESFGKFDASFEGIDQELLISMDSGHVQLKYQVDPEILYDVNNYAFRSEGSLKSERELRVLLKFL